MADSPLIIYPLLAFGSWMVGFLFQDRDGSLKIKYLYRYHSFFNWEVSSVPLVRNGSA
jgi:hypothetical protein